jgi:hypothetical protein
MRNAESITPLDLGFGLECGDASPLWVFDLGFSCASRLAVEKPKGKSQSGEASPHSKEKPKGHRRPAECGIKR